jgi:hypothetical protein
VKRDSKGRRNQQGELTKRKQQGIIGKGLHLHLTLLTCMKISYHCMNAANKRMCLGYNKPCVRGTRYMRLISWNLRSGSEQFIYNWKLETRQRGSGSRKLEAAERNGPKGYRKEYLYREDI